MAELAALSLAGNIIQFVDFGLRLFSEAKGIYDSTQGTPKRSLELEIVATDLRILTKNLQSTTQLRPRNLANELLKILDDLKLKGLYNKKWESFKQALKHVRKEDKIQKLASRLGLFQNQICIRLTALLRRVP
ncbi:hypothetical protein AOQ84DRAFT_300082 [Glonium stellatum]|uniref:NACHT-NTPase and P-loop NTPases N-terminal domain-containing protein n=1 Tax=Glonium stellatum TaxID=574774 RepID=A0A8E2JPJ0_9PEZI|nr:hypothetical protein AOQ84DRAFT_300082 [Glonium stellatum]